MKKIFLIGFLGVFIVYHSFAQSFTGGVLAGLVASQVDGDLKSGYNKVGFAGGGYVSLTFREKWALQMDIEYTMKGSRSVDSMNNVYRLNFNYIEVPLMVQHNFYKKYVAQIGLSVATLISKKETLNEYDLTKQTNYPKPASQNVSLIVGLRYPLGEHMTFDFRASNSIQSIRKGSPNVAGYINRFGKYGQYHNMLILSMYYKI